MWGFALVQRARKSFSEPKTFPNATERLGRRCIELGDETSGVSGGRIA